MAKRERQRLKEQARLKKEQLEQLRSQQNVNSESGEVSRAGWEDVGAADQCAGVADGRFCWISTARGQMGPNGAKWGGCEGLLWCMQADRGRKRMAFLLKQAEVFQHFAPATAASESKK